MASKLDVARRAAAAARKRAQEEGTIQAVSNAGGAVSAGFLKSRGILPAEIAGVDSAAVVGGALTVAAFAGVVPKRARPVLLGAGSGMTAPAMYQLGVALGAGDIL